MSDDMPTTIGQIHGADPEQVDEWIARARGNTPYVGENTVQWSWRSAGTGDIRPAGGWRHRANPPPYSSEWWAASELLEELEEYRWRHRSPAMPVKDHGLAISPRIVATHWLYVWLDGGWDE